MIPDMIPDKVGKPVLRPCLCESRASGLVNLVEYTLDASVSINHNLAVPLYLINVVSRAAHETRLNEERGLKRAAAPHVGGPVF